MNPRPVAVPVVDRNVQVNFSVRELKMLATFFGRRAGVLQYAGLKATPGDLPRIDAAWKLNHALWVKFSAALGMEAYLVATKSTTSLCGGDVEIGNAMPRTHRRFDTTV
jgi:hypothetical protein